jgi:hypothetical protein
MRAKWGIIALALAVTEIACHDKPNRAGMSRPTVQLWDLPDEDNPIFSKAPEYPKVAPAVVGQPSSAVPAGMKGLGGGGGGGGGGAMSGGNGTGGPGNGLR